MENRKLRSQKKKKKKKKKIGRTGVAAGKKKSLGLVRISKSINVNHGGLFRTLPNIYGETILWK